MFKVGDKVKIIPNRYRTRWITVGYIEEIKIGNPYLPSCLNWLFSPTYLIRSEDKLECGFYIKKELKHDNE